MSKGSTKTKTNGSQSKEKGDPLPQEAVARGMGGQYFCRSGKIMLLLSAECRKRETKIPLSDNCMRPHASRTPQDQFREWQDWLEITRERGRQGGGGSRATCKITVTITSGGACLVQPSPTSRASHWHLGKVKIITRATRPCPPPRPH